MKKNIKKKDIKVRDISNDKEVRTIIWLLFAIGIVLWGCFEVIFSENSITPATEDILLKYSDEEIIDKYKDDGYFKTAYKEYSEDIDVLEGQLKVKDVDSNEYNELLIQKEYLNSSLIRYSVYGMNHHYIMKKTFIMILIVIGIILLIFSTSFILITLKKFKLFNYISFGEVVLIFIFEIVYGNLIDIIISMEFNMIDTVRFLVLLFPILLNYLYSLYYKKDV